MSRLVRSEARVWAPRLVTLAVALAAAATALTAKAEAPATVASVAAGTPEKNPLRLHGVGSGRFEVVAEPGLEGVRLAELANAAWSEWSGPLGLPSRLPT